MKTGGKQKKHLVKRGFKKSGTLLKKTAKKIRHSKATPYVLVFIVGVGCGVYGNSNFAFGETGSSKKDSSIVDKLKISSKTNNESNIKSQGDSDKTNEEKRQKDIERIDKSVERAKEKIAEELEDGEIDKNQADTLNKKIDEIAEIRKTLNETNKEDRNKLRELKAEWRKWAEDNDLPYKYISRVT